MRDAHALADEGPQLLAIAPYNYIWRPAQIKVMFAHLYLQVGTGAQNETVASSQLRHEGIQGVVMLLQLISHLLEQPGMAFRQ